MMQMPMSTVASSMYSFEQGLISEFRRIDDKIRSVEAVIFTGTSQTPPVPDTQWLNEEMLKIKVSVDDLNNEVKSFKEMIVEMKDYHEHILGEIFTLKQKVNK